MNHTFNDVDCGMHLTATGGEDWSRTVGYSWIDLQVWRGKAMDTITFDVDTLCRFRAAYLNARTAECAEFEFDGQLFLSDYAKYVIEYLESILGA